MVPYSRDTKRRFAEAARTAAKAARAAKRAEPDVFGNPEMVVVKNDGNGFTWELRRFGGVVLKRGTGAFADIASAKDAGSEALTALRQTADLPKITRELRPKLSMVG